MINPFFGDARLRGGVSDCRPCEERSLHGTMPSLHDITSRVARRMSLTRPRRDSSLAGPRKEGGEAVSEAAGVTGVREGDGVAGGEVGSESGGQDGADGSAAPAERPGFCRRMCSLLMAMPFWYVSLVERNASTACPPLPSPFSLSCRHSAAEPYAPNATVCLTATLCAQARVSVLRYCRQGRLYVPPRTNSLLRSYLASATTLPPAPPRSTPLHPARPLTGFCLR